MFRKYPKIVSISSVAVGDFIFVFGVAKNGKVYAWHSATAEWKLHQQEAPNEQ